jgi:FG-GAP repeat protein
LSATATRADQFWHQDSTDIAGVAESGDVFGGALAAGDFNGDGRADLAVGVPLEDVPGPDVDAGVVNVLYGSTSGLASAGDQLWLQDSPGIRGGSEANDRFGASLAAGDLDGNARDDLAIGVAFEDHSTGADAGLVNVIYGSSTGLVSTGNQFWTQETSDVLGVAEAGDSFGRALAVGDFDHDNNDDLAVGVPGEDVSGATDGGVAHVIYGSASKLTAVDNQLFSQSAITTPDTTEPADGFGSTLAAGDFDGDLDADLAIGAPFEDTVVGANVGSVDVVYGSASGLSFADADSWTQSALEDDEEEGDSFGAAIAAGSFNGDAAFDLAVGVPTEDVSGVVDAGLVNVVYGVPGSGLTDGPPANQLWYQGFSGVLDAVEAGDMFGSAAG